MWQNLISDIQNTQSFFDKDPLIATVLIFLALGFLFFYFYSIICYKTLPSRYGWTTRASLPYRVVILGVTLFLLLGIVFPKSILLKLLIVVPIMALGWLLGKFAIDNGDSGNDSDSVDGSDSEE